MKKLLLSIGLCIGALGGSNLAVAEDTQKPLLRTTSLSEIKQGYVNTEKGQIHYWTAGNGPALFLIHQSAASGEEYAGLVPYLSDDFTLITYDWPGHGMSDDPEYELGVEEYTEAGEAVLNHLKIEKAHILGYHGGALVTMNMVAKNPDRFDKVILAGTSGPKPKEKSEKFSKDLDATLKKSHQTDAQSLADAWERFEEYLPNSQSGEILRPFLNNIYTRIRPYDAHYGVLRWDRWPSLDKIKHKEILITQGENDSFVGRQEKLLELLPNARREVVENAGVFMFYEVPEVAAELIGRFLKE